MKKILFIIPFIVLLGCNAKNEQFMSTSPDGKVQITFTGKKTTALDPWQVSINVKGYEFDETVMTELYNSAIDSTTIMVDWQNNIDLATEV